MTLDKSLRRRLTSSGLRSVLTRGERLEKLKAAERWQDGDSPLGLPKVRVFKLSMKKKKKKKEEGEEGAAATPAAAAPAAGKAPAGKAAAAPAKPAPGKGGKK